MMVGASGEFGQRWTNPEPPHWPESGFSLIANGKSGRAYTSAYTDAYTLQPFSSLHPSLVLRAQHGSVCLEIHFCCVLSCSARWRSTVHSEKQISNSKTLVLLLRHDSSSCCGSPAESCVRPPLSRQHRRRGATHPLPGPHWPL